MALAAWQATIVDESGEIQALAQVAVLVEATGAPSALFSDRDGASPIDNPVTADSSGFVRFYAAGNAYRITATLGSFSRVWRHVPVGTLGERDEVPSALVKYDRTAAEIAAGVTVVDDAHEEGEALRYGYIADDSTDNTTAIQNAIDVKAELGGGDALLPEGVARFASTLTLKVGVHLKGKGRSATVLKYTGSGVAIVNEDIFGAPPYHNDSPIKDLTLTTTTSAPSVGPGTVGVQLTNAAYVDLKNVGIRGFSTAGLQLIAQTGKACVYIGLDGCHIRENTKGLYASGVNAAINAINITNSSIRANIEWNIYSEQDVRAWNIDGCSLEAGGTGGTGGSVFLRAVIGLSINGCYFEQTNATPAIEFADAILASGISIKGNIIQGPGVTGTAIKLGTSAFVYGVDISGNEINGWSVGINPTAVIGGVIGPNHFTNVTTPVATPGSGCTGLVVHDGTSWKTYGAPISSLVWDGAAWGGLSPFRIPVIPIGSVAYGSLGTNTTPVAGTIYYSEVFLDTAKNLQGAGVLTGATAGTDVYIVSLYSATGTLLANSALAGTTFGATNSLQQADFTAPYSAAPGKYWIGVQLNGTTDRFRTIAASTFIDVRTKSVTGSFGTLPALTPPTTFTADVGPIAYVY